MLINTVHAGRGHSICRSFPATKHLRARSRRRVFSQLTDLPSLSEQSSPLVFRSTSINPYHNLAIEDYLLRNSAHGSHILFVYTNRPCVVIGRNQNPWLECDLRSIQQGLLPAEVEREKGGSKDGSEKTIPIDLVRRRSGGGTVFHDEGNLNYSVIVPNDASFKRAKHAEMVVRALRGIRDLDFKADIKVNERNDIVMQQAGESEWLKISGSAFKLIRGRALHHGTLLHSSPHLKRIGGLLRSPGRAMIRAKGVESVRSKVGNLLWTEYGDKRDRVRDMIVEAITRDFGKMYGSSQRIIEVGDEEIFAKGHEKIAEGAKEMMTNEWRFEQTPRFDFESGVDDQRPEDGELKFHVNRGVVEKLSCRIEHGDRGSFNDLRFRLHTVQDWSKTLRELVGDDEAVSSLWHNKALMLRMATIFPPWR